MYYASVVAYHIFFNSSKYLYFLLLLSFSFLYVFMSPTEMGNIKGWGALFSAAAYAHGDGSNSFWESLHPPQISPSSLSNQTFSHFN
ncbi:hypothetical protein V6N12_026669 [Hibiscus sabdariffa]|uniref:Uncharacterized protein n=1 Tax=Hibiscus sabdariffa TaxID=183260 RepID=A0ABR2DTW6_9ROSI